MNSWPNRTARTSTTPPGMIAEAMEAAGRNNETASINRLSALTKISPRKSCRPLMIRCDSAVAATANAATLTQRWRSITRSSLETHPDGYQAVKPRRELNGGRPLAPNEVAQPCHRARQRRVA